MKDFSPNSPYHLVTADAEVVADGQVVVDLILHEGEDLEGTNESIAIVLHGRPLLSLTWAEARELAAAITKVEEVARVG